MDVKAATGLFTSMSLSARRAWIEISRCRAALSAAVVALRKESVDRNNGVHYDNYNLHCVALRKESVDRNYYADKDADWVRVSLSARRAWIEICCACRTRNACESLSARRAWIEIDIPANLDADHARRSPQGERG